MLFHSFILICSTALSTCSVLEPPNSPFNDETVCERALAYHTDAVTKEKDFEDLVSARGHLIATCLPLVEGYNVQKNTKTITRRILERAHLIKSKGQES